ARSASAAGSLLSSELRRHPVGGLVAVAVPEVVHHVVVALDHRQHARTRDLGGELLGLGVRREAVAGAGDDVDRTGDVPRHALERHAQRHLARLLERGALRAHAEGLDVDRRPALEAVRARIGTREGHASLDAAFERRGARRVIAAERYAPDPGALRVDVAPRLEPVEHRLHGLLVFGTDGEVVLGLALARAVEGERGEPAREEALLVVVHLFLGR